MAVKESYAGKINRKLTKKLRVIAVAAGREKADLVLKNATYVNVFSNELCHGDIAVAAALSAEIEIRNLCSARADELQQTTVDSRDIQCVHALIIHTAVGQTGIIL